MSAPAQAVFLFSALRPSKVTTFTDGLAICGRIERFFNIFVGVPPTLDQEDFLPCNLGSVLNSLIHCQRVRFSVER